MSQENVCLILRLLRSLSGLHRTPSHSWQSRLARMLWGICVAAEDHEKEKQREIVYVSRIFFFKNHITALGVCEQ